jgi:hypothetical protein
MSDTHDAAGGVSTPASPGAKKVILYCKECQVGYPSTLTPLEDNKCLECKREIAQIGWIEYG